MDSQPARMITLSRQEGLARADEYVRRVVGKITFWWSLYRVETLKGALLVFQI